MAEKNTLHKNSRIIVVSGDSLFGPFKDQNTAESWIEHSNTRDTQMYTLWDAAEGTAESAQLCGDRLKDIDEASAETSGQHSRRVASAG